MAKLRDFQILTGSRNNRIYAFRFDMSEPVAVAYNQLRERIPRSQFMELPDEDWLIQVRVTPANAKIMKEIFNNFPAQLNDQMEMF